MKNRFGLSRKVPSSIRRQIRKEAGFGCVICGLAIGQCEHIDPEFKDAHVHDPERMTFLCIRCHGKVTIGHIAKDTIREAKKDPKPKQIGFSFEAFDISTRHPTVKIGPLTASNCSEILSLYGKKAIWIDPPEFSGSPFRINADLKNSKGESVLIISDNEWQANTLNWDVEVIGRKIIFRDAPGHISLEIKTEPPNRLVFSRMDVSSQGASVVARDGILRVSAPNGRNVQASNVFINGCQCAINVDADSVAFGYCGGQVRRNRSLFASSSAEQIMRLPPNLSGLLPPKPK